MNLNSICAKRTQRHTLHGNGWKHKFPKHSKCFWSGKFCKLNGYAFLCVSLSVADGVWDFKAGAIMRAVEKTTRPLWNELGPNFILTTCVVAQTTMMILMQHVSLCSSLLSSMPIQTICALLWVPYRIYMAQHLLTKVYCRPRRLEEMAGVIETSSS